MPAVADASYEAFPADESFDRYARIVRDVLATPVALVSLVEPDRQVFPGAIGLPEPWRTQRQTPLSHSFCQYVVADDAPLVIGDARIDSRLQSNLAIEDLGVIAYAGFPLHDSDGRAIGSLCAIDSVPREWTEPELRMLEDLAHTCATELALRESRRSFEESASASQGMSQRARVLLSLSEALAETTVAAEIAAALDAVAARHLGCNHAGIWLRSGPDDALHHVEHPSHVWPQARDLRRMELDTSNPVGLAVVQRRPVFYADRAAQDAEFPAYATPPREGDGQARALMPLFSSGEPLGVLALTWAEARVFDEVDRVTLAALTSYTAQAVHRAQLLAERSSVATTLQSALLSTLGELPGLETHARYVTAATADEVGGDWYDAVVLPGGAAAVVIGDVCGHDVRAAAAMGSLRNMLRTLAWAIDEQPSATVARLDQAARDLGESTLASLVYGRIQGGPGRLTYTWSNAGHPPPVLLAPDGDARVLDDGAGADCMIGMRVDLARRDQTVDLPPGSTLLLYTDGLVERRGRSLDDGIDELLGAVRDAARLAPGHLLDAVLGAMDTTGGADDVALLAVHVPFTP